MSVAAISGEATGVLLELGALLLGLGLLGRAALALRLSPIPLYLLAGLVLGAIDEGPITFSDELTTIGAEVGVVLLLFMLGLEYAGHELASSLRRTLPDGLHDFATSFTPGFAVGAIAGWGFVAALVMGGVTYISSSGLVAKVIADYGRQQHRETPAVLSVLVLEDLAMVVYLPLLAVLAAGEGLVEGARSLVIAALFAAGALVAAVRWGHHMTRALSPRSEETFLLTTFGFVLLVAGVAEQLMVSAAVGAFLAGIALSGPVVDRARSVITPLRDLFAAAFFVVFAADVDVGQIPEALPVAIGLAVLTGATKLWTGWRAAARAGADRAGRLRAGTALVARGEFSMVIAGIGIAAGIDETVGALAATYVLITALAGTVLTRWIDPEAELEPEPQPV